MIPGIVCIINICIYVHLVNPKLPQYMFEESLRPGHLQHNRGGRARQPQPVPGTVLGGEATSLD